MVKRRRSLSADWVAEASAGIVSRLVELAAREDPRRVGCYLALPWEVQAGRFVEYCWSTGREVWVPAGYDKTGKYEWCRYAPEDRLVPGPWGVTQPAVLRPMRGGDLDMVVVPGVAFDLRGTRLGHGGGHFDRLLEGIGGLKVGVAFDFQVVERLPVEPGDRGVDMVITERREILCHGRGSRSEQDDDEFRHNEEK